MFLYAELRIGISYQSFSYVPAMLRPRIKRLERQHDDIARHVRRRNGFDLR